MDSPSLTGRHASRVTAYSPAQEAFPDGRGFSCQAGRYMATRAGAGRPQSKSFPHRYLRLALTMSCRFASVSPGTGPLSGCRRSVRRLVGPLCCHLPTRGQRIGDLDAVSPRCYRCNSTCARLAAILYRSSVLAVSRVLLRSTTKVGNACKPDVGSARLIDRSGEVSWA